MTTRSPTKPTPLQRLSRRLTAWLPGRSPAVDYDQTLGVEHQGHITLVIARDGSRRPIQFRTSRSAAAWCARVKAGLLARQDALRTQRDLAALADGLASAEAAPWSTPDHLLAVLLTALEDASVSAADLEHTERGVAIRCRRFGRLHLGGTLPRRVGTTLFAALATRLSDGHEDTSDIRQGAISLVGGFPGPPLRANVQLSPSGASIRPIPPTGLFTDLTSWGASADAARMVRELLGRGPGLLLVTGRRDSGKSTLAQVCETEARLLEPGVDVLVLDEIDDLTSAHEALGLAAHRMVVGTLRADGASEALSWLRSLALEGHSLDTAIDGIVETSLVPLPCSLCDAEGCERCQRCGVIGRRGDLVVTRRDSTLEEPPAPRPVERERRKLTA